MAETITVNLKAGTSKEKLEFLADESGYTAKLEKRRKVEQLATLEEIQNKTYALEPGADLETLEIWSKQGIMQYEVVEEVDNIPKEEFGQKILDNHVHELLKAYEINKAKKAATVALNAEIETIEAQFAAEKEAAEVVK